MMLLSELLGEEKSLISSLEIFWGWNILKRLANTYNKGFRDLYFFLKL